VSDILYINGVDVDLLDVSISAMGAAWSPPGLSRTYVAIPGRVGVVPQGLPTSTVKRIPVTLWLRSTSLAGRQSTRDALLRHLTGLMRVEWSDAPDRYQWALIDQQDHSGLIDSMQFVTGDLQVETSFVIPDGVSWSANSTVMGLAADTETPVILGTATSAPRILAPGPWTDLRLSVMSPTGEELSALQLTGSAGAAEVVEIDASTETITIENTGTGVRTRALSLYGSGSFPILDPHDAIGTTMPSLLSTEAAVATYTRAWE
jgi:phage-related protein